MSLSKIYKSSKNFQVEKIVQREEPEEGWQADTQSEQGTFQSQKLDPEQILQQESSVAPPPLTEKPSNGPHSNKPPAEAVSPTQQEHQIPEGIPPPPQQTAAHPDPPEVDLSNYIERSEVDNLKEDAFRQGIEEGRQMAAEDYGSATKALLSVCQQLDSIRDTIIGNSGRELQDFALAIAQRILRISVHEQDHTIVATIDEALHRAVRSDEFAIFIHPDDFETVQQKSEDLIAGITGLNNLIIKTDNTIERGGARIESENCTIDATLAGQFDVIREEVRRKSQQIM